MSDKSLRIGRRRAVPVRSDRRAGTSAAGTVASLILAFACNDFAEAADSARLPGQTYESLRALPDWSGWWALRQVAENSLAAVPPPMRPEDLAKLRSARATPDAHADPGRFCRPEQFVGVNVRPAPSIEFLFTPGRVTLTNELGAVRRIYTDGRQLPPDIENSNMGTSIGHWEGQTLVVETAAINPEARFPDPNPGAIRIGRNAKVTERIALRGEYLEFDVVVTAPDILAAPYARKFSFARNPKKFPQELVICAENDRAIDSATGTQRFDLTPPADLPPPPSQ
jgi:hypothetical protein